MDKSKKLFKKECYRYTVEILEIASDEKRLLPLTGEVSIPLIKDPEEAKRLTKESLVVVDRDVRLRAESFDELRDLLRARYPDEQFERRLHVQRDKEAEERYERGMNGLFDLMVEAVVRDIKNECASEKVVEYEGEYRD